MKPKIKIKLLIISLIIIFNIIILSIILLMLNKNSSLTFEKMKRMPQEKIISILENISDEELRSLLRDEAKVILNRGLDFGEEGALHARLNVAMPTSVLEEVCQRILTTFSNL